MSIGMDLVPVEVIEDALLIANCTAYARENGALLTCHWCGEVEAPIVAILVMTHQDDEAWALCDSCFREAGLQYHG